MSGSRVKTSEIVTAIRTHGCHARFALYLEPRAVPEPLEPRAVLEPQSIVRDAVDLLMERVEELEAEILERDEWLFRLYSAAEHRNGWGYSSPSRKSIGRRRDVRDRRGEPLLGE